VQWGRERKTDTAQRRESTKGDKKFSSLLTSTWQRNKIIIHVRKHAGERKFTPGVHPPGNVVSLKYRLRRHGVSVEQGFARARARLERVAMSPACKKKNEKKRKEKEKEGEKKKKRDEEKGKKRRGKKKNRRRRKEEKRKQSPPCQPNNIRHG
jgi:hypothetical protein